jgi:hypothetical protein
MKKLLFIFIFLSACAGNKSDVKSFEERYNKDKFSPCLSSVNEFYCDSPILRLYIYYKFPAIIFCQKWDEDNVTSYYDDDKWFRLHVPECKDEEIDEVIRRFGE